MKLPLDWILQEPIDMEHKQYVLLDYITKIDKELNEFKLYPNFQELTIHLANFNSIMNQNSIIGLKKEPEENDDEILLANIKSEKIQNFTLDEIKQIQDIAKSSNDKLRDYFLIAKSIWSVIFESISVRNLNKGLVLTKRNIKKGFLKFEYKGEKFLYEFKIKKINPKYDEEKCTFELIERGQTINKKISNKKLLFEASFDNEFPLEGCLLSVTKRKVLNYINQSVKLEELKDKDG